MDEVPRLPTEEEIRLYLTCEGEETAIPDDDLPIIEHFLAETLLEVQVDFYGNLWEAEDWPDGLSVETLLEDGYVGENVGSEFGAGRDLNDPLDNDVKQLHRLAITRLRRLNATGGS